ncbi:MAG: c-type cytochrome domain-containing protein [Fodinibius sp.]|nr:c-type cytochrome domain-containing protein [Fodinibius sp.]
MNSSNKHFRISFDLNQRSFKRLLPILLCSLGLILGACGSSSTGPNNNGGDDNSGGNNGSEPPEPTFSNVQPIFNDSCGGSGCHIGESTNGVRLDSYENVINSTGTQYGTDVVVPGEPDNSPLIDKISNDNPEFGERMPEGGPPLSDEDISLIREWIANGAENN